MGLQAFSIPCGRDTVRMVPDSFLRWIPAFEEQNADYEKETVFRDSLHTGTDSSASVGLDSTKIVSLDEQTSVKFTKQAKALEMKLTEGTIFLDVQEKLQENFKNICMDLKQISYTK